MGELVVVRKFVVADKEIEADEDSVNDSYQVIQSTNNKENTEEELSTEKSLDKLLEDFNRLVGLQNIKSKLHVCSAHKPKFTFFSYL